MVTQNVMATQSIVIAKKETPADNDSCASTDISSKYNSFVSLAKDITIIKPKQFKPIIIQQAECNRGKIQKMRLLQKLLTEIKNKKSVSQII
jgi:hypothetical protein